MLETQTESSSSKVLAGKGSGQLSAQRENQTKDNPTQQQSGQTTNIQSSLVVINNYSLPTPYPDPYSGGYFTAQNTPSPFYPATLYQPTTVQSATFPSVSYTPAGYQYTGYETATYQAMASQSPVQYLTYTPALVYPTAYLPAYYIAPPIFLPRTPEVADDIVTHSFRTY